jgi:DNA-binding transcriptional LysR family regulator
LTKILEPAGIRPRRIQEVLLTEVILEMIIGGLGIAALPRWAVGPQVASGVVIGVPLQPPGYRWHWSVAQLRDNSPPDYLQEFVRIIADRPMLADFFPRARNQAGQRSLPRHAAAQPISGRGARPPKRR